jgi:phage replication-related protein YjqB (UPF0714/DUF867 family)
MADKYANFGEIAKAEKRFLVRSKLRNTSSTVVVAPHGGKIEPGTSEIAEAIAGQNLSSTPLKEIRGRTTRRYISPAQISTSHAA